MELDFDLVYTLRFIINGEVKSKTGGFKDFEKLLSGGGVKMNGGLGAKYKREETKLGLSLNTINFAQHRYF